jgi:hypothetical protein
MTTLRSLFLILATIATAACSGGPALPDGDADVAGTLSERLPSLACLGCPVRVLVERPALLGVANPVIVEIYPESRLYIVEHGGTARPASAAELAVGDALQVWTTGVERRTYPGEVDAVRIHIIR